MPETELIVVNDWSEVPTLRSAAAAARFWEVRRGELRELDRCLSLSAQPELLSALTSCHWPPAAALALPLNPTHNLV